MRSLVLHASAASASARRYLSCLRLQEILVLQGSPLIGAALAMRQPGLSDVLPLSILAAANMCLVAHVFLVNDWSNLTADARDPHRAAWVFTARGVMSAEVGALSAGLLGASLLAFSHLGPVPFGLSLAIAGLSGLYSLAQFDWKGKPLLSSAAHLMGGSLHFLLGYAVFAPLGGRGLATAAFFGVTFAAGHLTQEIRDHSGDLLNAIRTHAVQFGRRRTFAASVALFTLAYALLFCLALNRILPRSLMATAVLFPVQLRWSLEALAGGLTEAGIRQLQARYRMLYAVIGLAMVTAIWRR